MPRARRPTSTARRRARAAEGLGVVALAIEPTRWALLSEAVEEGVFRAGDAQAIARRRARFRGTVTTARDHAYKLEDAGLIARLKDSRGPLSYGPTMPGRNAHAYIRAAALGRPPEPIRSVAEGALLALVARPGAELLEAFRLDTSAEHEVVGILRDAVRRQRASLRARV